MDKIFEDFLAWIKSKDGNWKTREVIIDEIVESTHAHQIHINLHSEFGFGHIALYESNDIYWIEFEAVARDFENFYRYFEFDTLPIFDEVELEYIEFLAKMKNE